MICTVKIFSSYLSEDNTLKICFMQGNKSPSKVTTNEFFTPPRNVEPDTKISYKTLFSYKNFVMKKKIMENP